MTIKENMELLKTIFMSPRVVPGVSRLKLFSIVKHYGLMHLYVGDRVNHAIEGPEIDEETHQERSGRTILFHDSGDMHYYDILDENTRCLRQWEGFVVANHVCKNVENLSEYIQPKVKRIGGIK